MSAVAFCAIILQRKMRHSSYLEVLHHGLRPGHAVVLGVELGDLLLPLLPRQLVLAHHHRRQKVVRAKVACRVNLTIMIFLN